MSNQEKIDNKSYLTKIVLGAVALIVLLFIIKPEFVKSILDGVWNFIY